MVLEKIRQSSVAKFKFSCTYLVHGHDIQRNVGLTFSIQRLQTFFFIFATFLRYLSFFKFLFECFYIYSLTHPFKFCDIRTLWRSRLSARVPECRKIKKWWVRPVWR